MNDAPWAGPCGQKCNDFTAALEKRDRKCHRQEQCQWSNLDPYDGNTQEEIERNCTQMSLRLHEIVNAFDEFYNNI